MRPEWATDIAMVKATPLAQDVENVIAKKASRARTPDGDNDPNSSLLLTAVRRLRHSISSVLGIVVSFTVFTSILALGPHMDVHPDSTGWVYLEGVCAFVLPAELLPKVTYLERDMDFCGQARLWHLSDLVFMAWLSLTFC